MATKTYLLAPNFTYKPDGPLRLGAIISDPFRPTQALSSICIPAENISTVTETNHQICRKTGGTLSAGLLTHFVHLAHSKAPVSKVKAHTATYNIETIRTSQIAVVPDYDDPSLRECLAEPKLINTMKAGLFGRAPLFLVTGIKTASGLSAKIEDTINFSSAVALSNDQGGQLKLKVEIGGKREQQTSVSFSISEEVVFAYQLYIIKKKGLKGNTIRVEGLEPSAAFLHGDDEEEKDDEEEAFDVEPGVEGLLEETAEQLDMELESFEIKDGGENIIGSGIIAKDV